MPIYEYICKKCNKGFEILQKITEQSNTECPECKGKVEKVISQSSFHLKGAGWFKEVNKPKEKTSNNSCASPTTPCDDKGSPETKKCSAK